MVKNDKRDKRNKNKLKYIGNIERMVHLKNRKVLVNKGDVFDVSKIELESFKDKEYFEKVNKK